MDPELRKALARPDGDWDCADADFLRVLARVIDADEPLGEDGDTDPAIGKRLLTVADNLES